MNRNSEWACFSRNYRRVCMFYILTNEEWNGSKMSQEMWLYVSWSQTRKLSSRGCLLVSSRLAWHQLFVLLTLWVAYGLSLSYCLWTRPKVYVVGGGDNERKLKHVMLISDSQRTPSSSGTKWWECHPAERGLRAWDICSPATQMVAFSPDMCYIH